MSTLSERTAALLARWREAGGDDRALDDATRSLLPAVFGASEFVAATATREPGLLTELSAAGELARPRAPGEFAASARRLLDGEPDEAAFMAALRRLRNRELARIAWRDLAGVAPLREVLGELSRLVDALIAVALEQAGSALQRRHGRPRGPDGGVQELVVLAMGKLGGGELNFSSDIDLVFLYPEPGETDGPRPLANEDYFTRLGQSLIRLLDARTADGFVYRVDLRLRPFGESGPLVVSFGAFEVYLQQHGRDWERYAWVKARAVTGAARYRGLFDEVLRPFVYRRYLDFGVFESLRGMKEMIAREVRRRELQDDVKLGPGGIREIEFIAQAHQLIRGGSDPRLQTASLLEVLPRLAGAKLMPAQTVAELQAAYDWLRRTENRLQMVADQQTHALPADALGRERLAAAMDCADWPAFAQRMDAERAAVTRAFGAVVIGPAGSGAAAPVERLGALWAEPVDAARVADALARRGIGDAAAASEALLALRDSSYLRRLDEFGRRRLQALLPLLLEAVVRARPGDAAAQLELLRRLLRLVEAIGGRTAYLALLYENAAALERLVATCGLGDFLVRQIAAHPLLLDELLDARILEELPDRGQFGEELAARLAQAGDDEERQVDALREFRRAATFRIALLDLTGRLPLMQVSDRLTDVAELILDQALALAWRQMVAVHGEPRCRDAAGERAVRVAVAGYGKLGGMELSYASDLDLVFLHDSAGDEQQTAGPRVVENALFLTRLGQRLVHLLTVHTAAGRLYEVDMRLRPSGKGGLMFTQIGAFDEYQRQQAWTWEHQALLHSRWVAGDEQLGAEFERIRAQVLTDAVRRDTLREDVVSMRERMRSELAKSGPDRFDLKQDRGGIADIEFLAQYWVLRWAGEHPPLAHYADTIRQLESVGSAALVDHAVIDALVDAYRRYREAAHHLSLEGGTPVVAADAFPVLQARVAAVWEQVMVAGGEPAPV